MECNNCGEGLKITAFDPLKLANADAMYCKDCEPKKSCGSCGVTKSIMHFHADKSTKSGLYGQCKSCIKAKRFKSRYGTVKTADHVKIRRRLEEERDLDGSAYWDDLTK